MTPEPTAEQRLEEYQTDTDLVWDVTNGHASPFDLAARCAQRGYHLAKLSDGGCICDAKLPALAPPRKLVDNAVPLVRTGQGVYG